MTTTLDKLINLAIDEDIGTGDITTEAIVPPDLKGVGRIEAKQDMILAGLDPAHRVFAKIDSALIWKPACKNGDRIEKGGVIAEVNGSIASLLKGERIALNFLQHLSGIATFTRILAQEIGDTKAKILDTRKTLPAWRRLEKEAVRLGGGENHRMGLYDRYLIKNNHIEAAGSVTEAVRRVREKGAKKLLIEVETKNLAEVKEAASLGVDMIMLDNFTPQSVKDAVSIIKGLAKIEVSGGINLENIRDYAAAGADYISIGAITHSAPAADIHMVI